MIIFVTASADTYITNRKTQYVDAKTSNVGRAATLDFFKLYNENKLINSQGQIILTNDPALNDTITLEDADGNQYNINEQLIKEGHAYVYEGGKKKIFRG